MHSVMGISAWLLGTMRRLSTRAFVDVKELGSRKN